MVVGGSPPVRVGRRWAMKENTRFRASVFLRFGEKSPQKKDTTGSIASSSGIEKRIALPPTYAGL